MSESKRDAAWLSQYPRGAAQEANDEKRGYTEQCYTADQLHDAFNDGWAAAESASTPEPAAADMGHDWRLEAQSLAADVQRAEAHGRISNRDRPMVAAAQRILALASASPDRYPDRPAEAASPPASDADRCERTVHSFRGMVRCLLAKGHPGFHSYDEPPAAEVAAPTGEPTVILRCKRRKVPGDGGVVDGCGWQGPAPRVSCPSCGSLLLRPLPAAPKGTP